MLSHSTQKTLTSCKNCKRLRTYCDKIAQTKKKSTLTETYWGKPITGFGDPKAQFLIVGLAPGAHGANRTGRIFTGDRSGEWLYRELFESGFSNQMDSVGPRDNLKLKNAYITCIVKCAPPDNKPNPTETRNCLPYFEEELNHFLNSNHPQKVILALGGFAWQNLKLVLKASTRFPKFKHGLELFFPPPETNPRLKGVTLLSSFHPSQQNTFTGKLTREMFASVFRRAQRVIS